MDKADNADHADPNRVMGDALSNSRVHGNHNHNNNNNNNNNNNKLAHGGATDSFTHLRVQLVLDDRGIFRPRPPSPTVGSITVANERPSSAGISGRELPLRVRMMGFRV
jgi:hypothetical protein